MRRLRTYCRGTSFELKRQQTDNSEVTPPHDISRNATTVDFKDNSRVTTESDASLRSEQPVELRLLTISTSVLLGV